MNQCGVFTVLQFTLVKQFLIDKENNSWYNDITKGNHRRFPYQVRESRVLHEETSIIYVS